MNAFVHGCGQAVGQSLGQSLAPKEIGLLDRVAGIRSGLGEIRGRLDAFSARVNGGAPELDRPGENPVSSGLPSNLSEAEGYMRDILVIVGRLNDTF